MIKLGIIGYLRGACQHLRVSCRQGVSGTRDIRYGATSWTPLKKAARGMPLSTSQDRFSAMPDAV